MRKVYFLFTLFVSLNFFSQTASQDVGTVLGCMKSQEDSWNRGDIPGFMIHYWNSDSLKFVGKSGVTYGWKATRDKYLKNYPSKVEMGTLRFTIIEASQLSPFNILVIGKWELLKEKPAGGYFTLLWKKIGGIWVIVTDHTS